MHNFSDVEWANIETQSIHMDIASATLFYYEYILTIPDEVRLFWQHPRSLATVLYLLIRYASLVTNTARLVFSAPEYLYPKVRLTATGCQTLQDIVEIAQLISTAAGSAFIALRIMAVWSRNWYLGSILFVLGLINSTPLAQTLFFAFSGSVQAPPYSACSEGTESPTMALVVTLYVPLVASATNMAYELLCFVLVVSKTYRGYRVPHGSKTQPQLTYLLIRDGSLYFAAMIVMGIINLPTSISSPVFPAGGSLNESFSRSLVPILTMRFLANIKRTGVQDQTGASGLRLSTVPFAGGTQTDRLLQHITGNVQFSDPESENEYSTEETVAELDNGEAAPENTSGPQSTSDVV